MKKPPNKNSKKSTEPAIFVTSHLEEPNLLRILVENLAASRCDIGYALEQVQPGWRAMEVSSIEIPVSGSIIISDKKDCVSFPFFSCFLFGCSKTAGGNCNLVWISSLS